MGEYAKTYERIDEIENQKNKIKNRIMQLRVELEQLETELAECDIEQGECEGYLKELDYIDNGSEYHDWY